MVTWDEAPADTQWAKVAWEHLGLSANNLGSECYIIPDAMLPPSLTGRAWYFCSMEAAYDSSVTCLELPTFQPSASVYICSTPKGSRPSYAE